MTDEIGVNMLTEDQKVLIRIAREAWDKVRQAQITLEEAKKTVEKEQEAYNEAASRHSAFTRALRATGLTADQVDILLEQESIIS